MKKGLTTNLVVQLCIGSRTQDVQSFLGPIGRVGWFRVAWVGRVQGRLRADVVDVLLFGFWRASEFKGARCGLCCTKGGWRHQLVSEEKNCGRARVKLYRGIRKTIVNKLFELFDLRTTKVTAFHPGPKVRTGARLTMGSLFSESPGSYTGRL